MVSRSTVQSLSPDQEAQYKQQMIDFEQAVQDKIGSFDPDLIMEQPVDEAEHENHFDVGPDDRVEGTANDQTEPETAATFDPMLQVEIIIPDGEDGQRIGTVTQRKRDSEGNLIGTRNSNPLLDTRIYRVRFADGQEEDISYNLLMEHLYSQTDADGNQYHICLLYTSPSPRDQRGSRMPSSA